jgi:hypothetical protein
MKKANEIFMYCLGALIVLSFFAILALHSFKAIPEGNDTAVNISLGLLGAGFTAVVSFFFGSSAGSQRKTEIMGENQKQTTLDNKELQENKDLTVK